MTSGPGGWLPVDSVDTEFSETFARAIVDRGVTLQWLHRRLRDLGHATSVSAMSLWRSGRRRPESQASLEALELIEELLGLAPGRLFAVLGPSRRSGADTARRFDVLVGKYSPMSYPDELGITVGALVERSGHVVIDVDENRDVRRSTNRTLWQARRDGARQAIIHLNLDVPPPRPPVIVGTSGCSVRLVDFDVEHGLLTAALTLDRPLRRRESVMTERQTIGPFSSRIRTHYQIVALRRQHEIALWVKFHPDQRPRVCFLEVESDDRDELREIKLYESAALHVEHNFGPGRIKISWKW